MTEIGIVKHVVEKVEKHVSWESSRPHPKGAEPQRPPNFLGLPTYTQMVRRRVTKLVG